MKVTTVFVVVSHPVPYHVPMYRLLANVDGLRTTVFFDKDFINGFDYDKDVLKPKYLSNKASLLSGYEWEPLFSLQNASAISSLQKTISLLRRRKPDVVICFGYQGLLRLAIILLSRFLDYTIIYKSEVNRLDSLVEETSKAAIKRLFLRTILSAVPYVAVSCEAAAEYYMALKVPKRKIITMPCAVDNALIFEWQKQNNWKLRDSGKLKEFVFIGALEERKRPDLLIRAFLKVAKKHDVRLKVIGEGSLSHSLNKMCVNDPARSSVQFLGYLEQKEIFKVLSQSDALVLPSIKDPSPKVVNEAMCFGLLPVLSDQIGTVGDLVKDKEHGLIFSPYKQQHLESILYWAIENVGAVKKMRLASLSNVKLWTHERGVIELVGKLHARSE